MQKRFAKEVFLGKYKVLFSDTLTCNSIISFDDKFNVEGIDGVAKYNFDVFMDWDDPLENRLTFTDNVGKNDHQYSFQFSGDTLRLMNFKYVDEDYGENAKITTPAFLFKKI